MEGRALTDKQNVEIRKIPPGYAYGYHPVTAGPKHATSVPTYGGSEGGLIDDDGFTEVQM